MTDGRSACRKVRTTCPYCGVGCGLIVEPRADGTVDVSGDPDHPANYGRLCSKGAALGETLGSAGRLLFPEIGGRRVDWDTALDSVARTFSETIAAHGPDTVAFYVSGQILIEDYYVANKLMKGFIGSANIDTNSRLCMASSVAGHRRAFGSDTVPGTYTDLEEADLVVLVGSNLAWCHPVLFQRLTAARAARPTMRIVVIDPRRTMTADAADLHLPIAADGDGALFQGLLAHLIDEGVVRADFVAEHTIGFNAARNAANALSLYDIAQATGLAERDIRTFYGLVAETEKTVTVYSQGVNQSAIGTNKVNAIVNCHLATGRIGRPGMGPFSVTGQPNAMGGREVGGLANMLAAHMDLDNPVHRDRVSRFWQAPRLAEKPGLKAVDMFRAIAAGTVRAVWIMGTNPADSLPEAGLVEDALEACPFVVVSDVVDRTDTLRHADVRLPALGWGEKDGTVTNSERRISRQRAFLPPPGEARADWWQLAEVGRRMGFADAFDYPDAAAIFREHAALSAFENDGSRDFDIGAYAEVSGEDYAGLTPFQWPQREGDPAGESRFFAEGGFFHPDRRARFVVPQPVAEVPQREPGRLILNTGRVRDQWHTMTRTGRSPRLAGHIAEPFVELHPDDADARGIGDADIVRISSALGEIHVRALLTRRQQPGAIFVPMHWTDQVASNARVDRIVPARTDPVSGQPALKNAEVDVARLETGLFGFLVSTRRPDLSACAYWALAPCAGGWRAEFTLAEKPDDRSAATLRLLGSPLHEAGALSVLDDAAQGRFRAALFSGDRLTGALYLAPEPVGVSRSWVVARLSDGGLSTADRLAIIAGRPGEAGADRGALVCSCLSVGVRDIVRAVEAGCRTVDAVGKQCGAGTNCGSCRAEIRGIIDDMHLAAAE
ncbi:MAG: molybdopterin-dependent oxidoreductase [Pseudomonadota bacterium]